jgi:hypothetical protein
MKANETRNYHQEYYQANKAKIAKYHRERYAKMAAAKKAAKAGRVRDNKGRFVKKAA